MSKFILFLLFTGTLADADFPVKSTYTLTKSYSVIILGTSNLRTWRDTVGTVTGDMVADLNEDGSLNLHAIHIKMEVCSIKSNIGTALDNKTYRALKSDKNPEILFLFDAPVKVMQVNSGDKPLSLKGYLTLAGVCRPVTMQVNVLTLVQGRLQFEGSQAISMTDYGVKPPTVLFGAIKAHSQIKILFKTNFTNKQNEL
jgi:polyisoprenoid-binding protein YceI